MTRPLALVLERAAGRIASYRRNGSATLVAMSGIDGSGKSFLSGLLEAALGRHGLKVAPIGLDPWQNPQSVRLGGADPGVHFYRHVFRWGPLFEQLVTPLLRERSVRLETRLIRTDADVWYDHSYHFEDVDVVLLEGIFLLRRELAPRYDSRIWVDCSFETALARALARNQEGLPPERIREDYERIYFPAQRHHFRVDAPIGQADLVLDNNAASVAAPRRAWS